MLDLRDLAPACRALNPTSPQSRRDANSIGQRVSAGSAFPSGPGAVRSIPSSFPRQYRCRRQSGAEPVPSEVEGGLRLRALSFHAVILSEGGFPSALASLGNPSEGPGFFLETGKPETRSCLSCRLPHPCRSGPWSAARFFSVGERGFSPALGRSDTPPAPRSREARTRAERSARGAPGHTARINLPTGPNLRGEASPPPARGPCSSRPACR